VTTESLSTLAPHQLGVEVHGGAESIIHAACAFDASASSFHALVKLDFSNAFNTVCCGCLFEATHILFILLYVICPAKVSLSLNDSNCKNIGFSEEAHPDWILTGLKFRKPKTIETMLLGAPLFNSGFQFALDTYCKSVSLASNRLQYLSSHEAFFPF